MFDTYLIRLKPLKSFFFGGAFRFKRDFKRDDAEDVSSVVRPNKYPQQTSLLGMLRFFFLSHVDGLFENGCIVKERMNDVKKLIGEKSFNMDDTEDRSFGIIHSISPCFLQMTDDKKQVMDIYFSPMDCRLTNLKYKGDGNVKTDYIEDDGTPCPYSSKCALKSDYYSDGIKEDGKEGIFVEDERIGINCDPSEKTKNNAFYKQIYYRFNDHIGGKKVSVNFAFEAELDLSGFNSPISQNHVVALGGDDSLFSMTINKISPEVKRTYIPEKYKGDNYSGFTNKIVLVSDAWMEKIPEKVFNISETIPFLSLSANVESEGSYTNINGALKRSRRCNLYKRGSVFYFVNKADLGEFKKNIEEPRMCKIGYNRYECF